MRRFVGLCTAAVLMTVFVNVPPDIATAQTDPATHRLLYTTWVDREPAVEGEPARHPAVATMAADGSGARVVSPPDVRVEMPTASPGGRWIVYTTHDSAGAALKVIPAAGGEERLVAENASSAAWSADGGMLGYVSGLGYEREVVVAEVVEGDGDVTFSVKHRIPVHGYVTRPTFSPSGDAVVFNLAPGGDWNEAELWAAAVDGSQRWLLSPGLTTGWGVAANYSWSPDGSWVVFLGSGSSEPGAPRAHLVRPDGSGLRRLSTQTCNYDDAVAWEPYGRYLAVIPACADIHLVATDGSLINTVATEETDWFGRDIVFSPDGTSLYVTAQDRMNEHRLLQIPVDGSDVGTLQPVHPVDGSWLELLGPVHRPATPPPMPPPPPDEPPAEEWKPQSGASQAIGAGARLSAGPGSGHRVR